MTIVVDASVALRWCFHLNGSDRAEELLRSDHHVIAPDLVIAEIARSLEIRDIRQDAGAICRICGA